VPAITVVRAARLLDGTGAPPLESPCLVLEGERIAGVFQHELPPHLPGSPITYVDLPDATLLPGLIDCHVHLNLPGDGTPFEEAMAEADGVLTATSALNARRALEAGVTTLRDCGGRASTTFDLRRALALGRGAGSRLVLSGRPITVDRGHCWPFGGEAQGEERLRRMVRELASAGADFIKVIGSGGGTPGTRPWVPAYSREELAVIVETARALERRVSVHSLTGEATARAVAAGASHLEHASFTVDESGTQAYDPALASRIAEAGVGVTPTLSPRYHMVAALRAPRPATADGARELARWERSLDVEVDHAGRLRQAGVRLVAGSDAGWRHTPFGALVDELELLCRAGLSPGEAIVAATGRAAEVVGLADRIGRLRPGYVADLIAVEGNPLQDIGALRRLALVMRDGRVVASGRPSGGSPTARN
jgi:imidazolonepropionase-like amidohydrolase